MPELCGSSGPTVVQTRHAGHFDGPQTTELECDAAACHHGDRAVTPPENTSCPAFSTSPSAASWLASHATDAAGWPSRQRRPLSHDLPCDPHDATDQPQILHLTGPTGDGTQVKPPALALSATTSVRVNEALVARIKHVYSAEDDLGGGQHRDHRGRRLDVAGQ